jgi:hypothetical protein
MAGGLQQVLVLPGGPGVYRECLSEIGAVQAGEGCEGEDEPVKRACVLLVTLLCSCMAHCEGGDGAEAERLPFLDRSDPLVKRTLEIMEKRAQRSKQRELLRAEGRRVCEEGESRTHWEEICKTCWCERGVLYCEMMSGCSEPSTPADWERYEREKAERYSQLREVYRVRGERVCEEGEDGTRWQEDCDTCWCEAGLRACTTRCVRRPTITWPPPYDPSAPPD